MDNFSILAAAVVSALSVLGLVIKSLLADRKQTPTNGNGKNKQLDDVETKLTEAIAGFRESHLEERMVLKQLTKELEELKTLVGICADILKKI